MGLLKKKNKKVKKAEEEFKARAMVFLNEFRELRKRWGCDFQAYFRFIDGGKRGIIPAIEIIDVKNKIKDEQNEKRENKS